MPFWFIPSQLIRNHCKRHFRCLGATDAPANPMPPKQTIPPQTSPWANIPSELLCHICDQAFSETSAHYGVEMLALVCKLWYQIVTGYGRPWCIIRIEPNLHKTTLYPTMQSYVNTRLKHSHHYPLEVTIHPVALDWPGHPNFLQKDIRSAIDAVVGGGLHARRWGVLNATVHPYVRARLKYPTPILRRVTLDGINQYGHDLGGLFTVAPKLEVLSLTGTNMVYYLHLPASTSVTLDHLQLAGFSIFTCVSILERFVKTQRLTTLELTGSWSNVSQRAPVMLPTVRTLSLNARGPICAMFSAIILPALVQFVVIGGGNGDERQNVLDDHDAFKLVASKLETLRLESLHFDNTDHLKKTLVAAPKVKGLTMKNVSYQASVDPNLKRAGERTIRWVVGVKSREPSYVTLLKDPLIFPTLRHCTVDDIDREDLVLLRRPPETG